MTRIPAAAYFDLTRSSRALSGIASQAEHQLSGCRFTNLPRALKNEGFQLGQVISASPSSPHSFTGAIYMEGGIAALESAAARIQRSRELIDSAPVHPKEGADVTVVIPLKPRPPPMTLLEVLYASRRHPRAPPF